MFHRLAVSLVALTALFGASCRTSTFCTAEARVSLIVNVVDETGKAVCGAVVTARDGSFSAEIQEAPNRECSHGGVPERKGNYSIDVRDGPRHTTVDDVKVTADQCHVHTRRVTVVLSG